MRAALLCTFLLAFGIIESYCRSSDEDDTESWDDFANRIDNEEESSDDDVRDDEEEIDDNDRDGETIYDEKIEEMRENIRGHRNMADVIEQRLDQWEAQHDDNGNLECDPCMQHFEPIGCYTDKRILGERPLPHLLDNHRVQSGKPAGDKELIQWNSFERSVQSIACHCARLARAAKHHVFGLQFYGECFSGPNNKHQYKKYGKAHTCIDGDFRYCNATSGRFCVGEGYTNFVYKLNPMPTPLIRYAKVGCFRDHVGNRAMPELLTNHRDKANKLFKHFDWKNYRATVKRLLDECVKLAKERGYKYIGLQFYGECWSSEQSELEYNKHGTSTACVNPHYKKCDTLKDCTCIGEAHTNFVYKLI